MPQALKRLSACALVLGLAFGLSSRALAQDAPAEAPHKQKLQHSAPLLKGKQSVRVKAKSQSAQTAFRFESNLTPHKVVGDSFRLLLAFNAARGSGSVQVLLDGGVRLQQRIPEGQRYFTLDALKIPPGQHRMQYGIQWDNDPQSYLSPEYTIFNLGVAPPDHSYVIVDKASFSLYWIQNGVLKNIYPIATGRPRTPTVPGFWLIGKKEVMPNPNTSWGVRRLRIYRDHEFQRHWSGYAIHGTNRPPSIGTEASHGCVRMFNEDVTELWQEIEIGTPVIIEDKLKVYIDEI